MDTKDHDDNSEKRELKPANENPWYLLATLYGEPSDSESGREKNSALMSNNVQAWNKWYVCNLSFHEKRTWREKEILPTIYDRELSNIERDHLLSTYRKRANKPLAVLPDHEEQISFESTNFDKKLYFSGMIFTREVSFANSQFKRTVSLMSALFSKKTSFNGSSFMSHVILESSVFLSAVYFYKTIFRSVSFDGAKFKHRTSFGSAIFQERVYFLDATFNSKTIFSHARFESFVPDFRGAELHEATEFTNVRWPPIQRIKGYDLTQQVYAYERLKLEMEKLKKYEDEQMFFRKELRAKRELLGMYPFQWILNYLYEKFSGYGYSVGRPFMWLVFIFFIGSIWLIGTPNDNGANNSITTAFNLSFSGLFSIFPLQNEYIKSNFHSLATSSQVLIVFESFFGALMLFLIGLALRNRFRMK